VDDGTFRTCETCGRPAAVGDAGVIEAVERVRTDSMDGTEYIDGYEVLFHRGCYPSGTRRYRLK
jgi:hypothetical protein